jgi:hypothetical protein
LIQIPENYLAVRNMESRMYAILTAAAVSVLSLGLLWFDGARNGDVILGAGAVAAIMVSVIVDPDDGFLQFYVGLVGATFAGLMAVFYAPPVQELLSASFNDCLVAAVGIVAFSIAWGICIYGIGRIRERLVQARVQYLSDLDAMTERYSRQSENRR